MFICYNRTDMAEHVAYSATTVWESYKGAADIATARGWTEYDFVTVSEYEKIVAR